MSAFLDHAEFAADRQFVDVVAGLPDARLGWTATLVARGAGRAATPPQPCLADGGGRARVRFYPFLPAGRHTLSVRLLPPGAGAPDSARPGHAADAIELGKADVPPLDDGRAHAWLAENDNDLTVVASRSLVPLCVDLEGKPCFWPARGGSARRVAVLSVPKAGTYLFTDLLAKLGILSCNVHVGRSVVADYRLSKQMPAPLQRTLDVVHSARLVRPGQSMASHMGRDRAVDVSLRGYDKIFVFRELRAALVSAFRTEARRPPAKGAGRPAIPDSAAGLLAWLEQGHLERLRGHYESVARWHGDAEVCAVSFEDVMGDAGPDQQYRAVVAVAARCGVELAEGRARNVLRRTLGAATQTYSGARSSTAGYWTPRAEELFCNAGLARLNARLGYAEPSLAA